MWLTAWTVSYMALKFASRARSHSVPACSGLERMALPEFSLIVLTIAEENS